MNALIATIIVIGDRARVDEAADALDAVRDRGAVRRVLISEGTQTKASADEQETTIRIDGLSPQYVDNAVAWLRLSSLPAVVWWRGGPVDTLERLAHLADRLVLDTDPPDAMWQRAPALFEETALTDLRWSALTCWRSALAHLVDLPQVREGLSSFRRVEIAGPDRSSSRLFGGWLRASFAGIADLEVRIDDAPACGRAPLNKVRLSGGDAPALTLDAQDDRACLAATVEGASGSRIVPLGDGSLASRFIGDLGVRTRDAAFERALVAAMELDA